MGVQHGVTLSKPEAQVTLHVQGAVLFTPLGAAAVP